MWAPRRSWFCVPAIKKNFSKKLASYGADVVLIDLEDSIPETSKDAAREVFLSIEKLGKEDLPQVLYVRINERGSPFFNQDLAAAVHVAPKLTGIFLPKVTKAQEIRIFEKEILSTSLQIVPIMELLRAEKNASEIISASDRIRTVIFAETGDYTVDFGFFQKNFDAMKDSIATEFALRILKAAKMYGKEIVDSAYLAVRDKEGLRRRCQWAFDLGFDGKLALHPEQIPVINEVMMPSDKQIQEAMELVELYEKNKGENTFIPHKSGFITPPRYKAAKVFLKKYEGFLK